MTEEKNTSEETVDADRSDYMDADGFLVENGATEDDIAIDRETNKLYMGTLEKIQKEYNLSDEQVETVMKEAAEESRANSSEN